MSDDSAFIQKWLPQIEAMEVPHTARVEAWEKRFMAKQGAHSTCAYCGTPIAKSQDSTHRKWMVDFLIPMHLGGADHPKNLVLCCAPCHFAKDGRDWIEWLAGPTMDARVNLAKQRTESLEESMNHVIPLATGKGKSARKNAKAYISKRWAYPRFRVYATVTELDGWIAINSFNRALCAPLQVRLLLNELMSKSAGVRIEQNGWRIYRMPLSIFHDVAFQLIERNALLVNAGTSCDPHSLEPEHYRRWFIHLKGYEWIQDVVDHANELKLLRHSLRVNSSDDVPTCVIDEQRQVEKLKDRKKARSNFDV